MKLLTLTAESYLSRRREPNATFAEDYLRPPYKYHQKWHAASKNTVGAVELDGLPSCPQVLSSEVLVGSKLAP